MTKINVYSSSASNAIKVFDASSTGVKPNNAILVTTGSDPSNAIQINIGEKKWNSIAVNFGGEEPGPGPTWETVTIGDNVWMAENLKYDGGNAGIYEHYIVNDVDFGPQYLYTVEGLMSISSNFPGWHIPTESDIELLYNDVAGNCETLRTTSGWHDGRNGNDLKGFHLEPVIGSDSVNFGDLGSFYFISNNENISAVNFRYDNLIYSGSAGGTSHRPIRLVKDSE